MLAELLNGGLLEILRVILWSFVSLFVFFLSESREECDGEISKEKLKIDIFQLGKAIFRLIRSNLGVFLLKLREKKTVTQHKCHMSLNYQQNILLYINRSFKSEIVLKKL